jgi:hypothetical protein
LHPTPGTPTQMTEFSSVTDPSRSTRLAYLQPNFTCPRFPVLPSLFLRFLATSRCPLRPFPSAVPCKRPRRCGKIMPYSGNIFRFRICSVVRPRPSRLMTVSRKDAGIEHAPFLVKCRKTFGARLDRAAADRRSGRRPVDPRKAWRAPSADSRRAENIHCSRLRRSPPPPDGCAG